MEKCNNLSKNLKAYQNIRNLSLMEFSKELDIPMSTLKAILKDGNTTLATAIRISNSLDIGLDMLIYDKHFPEKLFILHYIDNCNNWYSSFPDEKKDQISGLLEEFWEVIDK